MTYLIGVYFHLDSGDLGQPALNSNQLTKKALTESKGFIVVKIRVD